MRKSMENLSPPKVVAISDTPHDSLQAAVNQFLLWEMRSRDCINPSLLKPVTILLEDWKPRTLVIRQCIKTPRC